MLSYFYTYIATLISILIIDGLWIGYIAAPFYKQAFGSLMKSSFDFTAAGLFYVIYIVGLLVFVIVPQAELSSSMIKVGLCGALFGFMAYMTYDLVNMATLVGWSWKLSIIDMAWGTFVTGVVSCIGYYVYKLVA